MNDSSSVSAPFPEGPVPPLQTPEARITCFFGHAFSFLTQLQQQHLAMEGTDAKIINEIYSEAQTEINNHKKSMISTYNKTDLTKKEIKNLAKELKKHHAIIGEIAKETQLKVKQAYAYDIGKTKPSNLGKNLDTLMKGGIQSIWLRFLALIPGTESSHALQALNQANEELITSWKKNVLDAENPSLIDKNKQKELEALKKGEGQLKHRKGVIGISGTYQFVPAFSKKKLTAQFKQFIQQELSDKQRVPIRNQITIPSKSLNEKENNIIFSTELTPMNKHLDEALGLGSNYFEKLLGEKGIASSDTGTAVNVYRTQMEANNQVVYSGIRHGVTADIHETNRTKRKKIAKEMANEIVLASVLQHISNMSMSLDDDFNNPEKPLEITITSMSLLTPDSIRRFHIAKNDERRMLIDQTEALHAFEGPQQLRIAGKQIAVNLKIQTFNFGVNVGAVGMFHAGNRRQNRLNQQAFDSFYKDLNTFNSKLGPVINKVSDTIEREKAADNKGTSKTADRLQFLVSALNQMENDIQKASRDRKAYLTGDNQFELGAKILTATHLMEEISKLINPLLEQDEKLPGHQPLVNCKSGKDRTGVMNDVLLTLGAMATLNGKYPSREELSTNEKIRKQFTEILVKMMLESGSISITEINTDVTGYKIDDVCRLVGMSAEEFTNNFRRIQGLSKTANT